ncbi:MAG TPA: hypothetical protein VGI79_13165 [Caulobacteraceae bacterium]|jgi:hypothetical protein
MSLSRGEALTAAKKLLRTFDSAPDPQGRARQIYSELCRAEGMTNGEHNAVEAFGAWLDERPRPSELKPRCQGLLLRLK